MAFCHIPESPNLNIYSRTSFISLSLMWCLEDTLLFSNIYTGSQQLLSLLDVKYDIRCSLAAYDVYSSTYVSTLYTFLNAPASLRIYSLTFLAMIVVVQPANLYAFDGLLAVQTYDR